jgi:hypothetical protein
MPEWTLLPILYVFLYVCLKVDDRFASDKSDREVKAIVDKWIRRG